MHDVQHTVSCDWKPQSCGWHPSSGRQSEDPHRHAQMESHVFNHLLKCWNVDWSIKQHEPLELKHATFIASNADPQCKHWLICDLDMCTHWFTWIQHGSNKQCWAKDKQVATKGSTSWRIEVQPLVVPGPLWPLTAAVKLPKGTPCCCFQVKWLLTYSLYAFVKQVSRHQTETVELGLLASPWIQASNEQKPSVAPWYPQG